MNLVAASYIALALLAHPAAAETLAEGIIAEYQADCVATIESQMDPTVYEDPAGQIRLTVNPASVYELDLGTKGTKATVVFADFNCPSFGTIWCGSGGCNTHIIVEGKVFGHFGGKPASVRDGSGRAILLLPAQGTACQNTGESPNRNAAPCIRTAVWDDFIEEFQVTGAYLHRRSGIE